MYFNKKFIQRHKVLRFEVSESLLPSFPCLMFISARQYLLSASVSWGSLSHNFNLHGQLLLLFYGLIDHCKQYLLHESLRISIPT